MTAVVYEVTVEGELGESLLRYLDCPHRVAPPRSVVRLDAVTGPELAAFLEACRRAGVDVERVRAL
jgi:hypothetical protein